MASAISVAWPVLVFKASVRTRLGRAPVGLEPITSCPLRRSGFPCILAGGSRAWVALSLPDPLSQVAGSCLTAVCLPQQRKFTIKKGQKAKSTWAVGLSPSFPSHVAHDISSLKQKKVANFIFEFRAAWDRRWKI